MIYLQKNSFNDVVVTKTDYYVYFHINPVKNQIFYVGKGRGKRAWSKHNRNPFWQNTVDKYGWIVNIVEEGLTNAEACEREIFYIKKIGRINLCNLTDGGEGGTTLGFKGKNHTKESIEKNRIAHLGKSSPNKDKTGKPSSKKGIKLGPQSEELKDRKRRTMIETWKRINEEKLIMIF